MGAELWHHAAPWRDDPAESLFEVQVGILRKQYDLSALIRKHLASAREAFDLTQQNDEYGLHDFYRGEAARLEELATLPSPAGPQEEIDRLRTLYSTSGEGIGSILDVTHVDDRGGMHVARRLPDDEIRHFCKTARPTLGRAVAAVSKVNEKLRRGDSVCFPYYDPDGTEPAGWYFVGNTID